MSNSKLQNDEKRWQCALIYLKKTTDVLHLYIKARLMTQLQQWHFDTEKFKDFSKKVNSENYVVYKRKSNGRGQWETCDNNSDYKNILRKILDIHSSPANYNIHFDSNDDDKCKDVEPYWILAKIFMPYGNRTSRTPEESDVLSFFDLLRNCLCFSKDFDTKALDELCTGRYTITNKTSLTEVELNRITAWMTVLLNTPCLKHESGVARLLKELNDLDGTSVIITSPDLKRLKQVMEDYYPGESFSSVQLTEGTNELFNWGLNKGMLELKEEIQKENQKIDEHKSKLERCKKLGGVTGMTICAGAGIAVGGAAWILGGSAAISPMTVIESSVAAAKMGKTGGSAGGAVVADIDRISM